MIVGGSVWLRSWCQRIIKLLFILSIFYIFLYRNRPLFSLGRTHSINYQSDISQSNGNTNSSIVAYSVIMNALSTELLQYPPIHDYFLKRSKNPCFYVQADILNIVGSDIAVSQNQTISPKAEMRCLPYFLLVGFSKCGTSDLWKWLTSHPEIFGPARKEPHFWDMWKSVSVLFYSLSFM